MSDFPDAIDPSMVGEYPALAKSGAGYFYDHVLEYRVWCHPERGAEDLHEGDDYYYPFETYAEALEFSRNNLGTEEPIALVKQLEWVNEPEIGVFEHKKEERITEWKAEWLSRGSRKQGAIEAFIKERRKKP
jgi:hypothetical protein